METWQSGLMQLVANQPWDIPTRGSNPLVSAKMGSSFKGRTLLLQGNNAGSSPAGSTITAGE